MLFQIPKLPNKDRLRGKRDLPSVEAWSELTQDLQQRREKESQKGAKAGG